MRYICSLLMLAALLAGCGSAPQHAQPSPTAPQPTQATPAPQPTAATVTPPPGAGDQEAVLVRYHKSGGIAGIDETLTVYADGRIALQSRMGAEKRTQAAASELAVLQKLLVSPEFAQLQPSYQSEGADQFRYEIMLPGRPTIATMDGAPNPPALDQALEELERLRRMVR